MTTQPTTKIHKVTETCDWDPDYSETHYEVTVDGECIGTVAKSDSAYKTITVWTARSSIDAKIVVEADTRKQAIARLVAITQ